LSFSATPGDHSQTGWAGHGEAQVCTSRNADQLRMHENGHFTPSATGTPVVFRNVYLWVLRGDRLSLWHERFGREAAVWLFDLAAVAADKLATIDAHQCGSDRYSAALALTTAGFDLRWSITGPRKDETLAYSYRS